MSNAKTEQWRTAAHEVLKTVARQNQYVVSDMVVTALEAAGLGLDNYSSLGGVFIRAAKAGFISKTDERKQSTRAKSNSAKTVWVSTIYRKPGATDDQNIMTGLLIAALEYNGMLIAQASMVSRAEDTDENREAAIHAFTTTQKQYDVKIATILSDYKEQGNTRKGKA